MIFDSDTVDILNQGCPMLARSEAGSKLAQLESLITVGFGGTKFYLDPVNGLDTNNGLTPITAVKTLAVGYALLTANKNDMLFLIGGASAISLAATFAWAKAYTHFIGLTASLRFGGRAEITASANHTPIFNVTASGCQFANLSFIHDQDDVGNLVNVSVAGDYNSFYNCHFQGPGHATIAGVAYKTLSLAIGAICNTFSNCAFGLAYTLSAVATGTEIEILGTISGTEFVNCVIVGFSSDLNHKLVQAAVSFGAEGSVVTFDRCRFINMDNDKIQTIGISAPTTGNIHLIDCKGIRIAAWSTALVRVIPVDSSIA